MIDNKFLIKHTFHGLVQGHFEQQVKQPIATGIHFDPRTGALVLNGRTGHLQFYDIKTEQQMFTVCFKRSWNYLILTCCSKIATAFYLILD